MAQAGAPALRIEAATLHNLKHVNVSIPLQQLVAVTGVSGSGKSTLARDVVYASLHARKAIGCAAIHGLEHVDRVLEVDQTPIGKTPRSCPATYVGLWDQIRAIYAATSEARLRGYGAGRFSFNTAGGRCEACEGQGMQTVEMNFLPDVKVLCDVCAGRRFNPETLAVTYRDRNIGDVLAMPIDDAVDFFRAHSRIHHALQLLCDVGLGYLTLGQPSPTLSGGEAQRIKLVTELARVGNDVRRPRARPQRTFYVLDEPTVGLHMADVERLIQVLQRLVDSGNSVLLVEHNLDLIAACDMLIDMGPEAGGAGGQVVAAGAPQKLAQTPRRSHTAQVLGEFLRRQ